MRVPEWLLVLAGVSLLAFAWESNPRWGGPLLVLVLLVLVYKILDSTPGAIQSLKIQKG